MNCTPKVRQKKSNFWGAVQNTLDIMRFILLHFILKLSFCSAARRFTSKTLWMPIVCGLFHCKSQKVKVANSLILLGKIKERTRKLDIDSSKYWFDIEDNDKFADRFRIILFENQIQTTSTSPCRTQVQPVASFLVCSLIFIEYKARVTTLTFWVF